MNLQRREEIRAIAERMSEHWSTTDARDAISELLAHIDALEQTAAERVIARGGQKPQMKPHRFAQMVNEVRELAFDFGATEQFRCRVADLLGKYIHVEHNSKGVPESYHGQREHVAFLGAVKYELENPTPDQKPTTFDINRDYFENYANVFSKENERMAHGVGFMNGAAWHRERYAIPADRVLGEGMVAVDRGLLMLLDKALERCRYSPQHYLRSAIQDALRANQGGGAT